MGIIQAELAPSGDRPPLTGCGPAPVGTIRQAALARYRTIVADPPWPIPAENRRAGRGGRRGNSTAMGYRVMALEDIYALPVSGLAEADAHLFLWITPRLNREGAGVACAEAWGFRVVSEIIWAKPNFGLGAFPRPQHEPLLVCRRGSLPFALNDVGSVQRWNQVFAKTNGGKVHSAKPDGALDLIERASPGPYLELFARRARFGWDYWGDESLGTAEMVVA